MRLIRTLCALTLLPAALAAQRPAADTNHAGRFDLGRMWTFEYTPAEYFSTTYGFTADSAWFARARMAALRIPGCSAAFVSRDGLIITNHHCVRGSVNAISRAGENLLDSGFVAATPADERRLPNMVADQLLAALDVSQEVNAAGDAAPEGKARDEARRAATAAVQARLRTQYASSGDSVMVQIVPLYNGARTSAYVFRRYTDVRLVVAAELGMANIGGDWDNFTYPRYALDFAVMRAYAPDGRPVASPDFFTWGGTTGVQAGDPIFVIGNPGATRRLTTISQLEFQRDVALPLQNRFLASRLDALKAYRDASSDDNVRRDILVTMLGLSNSWKPIGGRLDGLRDSAIMGRRTAIERALGDSIRARPALRALYSKLFDRMTELQRLRTQSATTLNAFSQMTSGAAGSTTLQAAYWAWRIQHGPADSAVAFRQRLARVRAWPRDLERRFVALSLDDIARAYGPTHAFTRAALGGRTAAEAADAMLSATSLADSSGRRRAAAGELNAEPALKLMDAVMPTVLAFEREQARLAVEEAALSAQIGRARFEVYGPAIPPDGSSSPRIADGVVQGYEYNGTLAPPYTTFYGVYDRNRSFGDGSDWALPYRWRTPPAALDLGTPLNFVSTVDSYGGNSGSPAVTKDLRVVGLNFDRNINALVRDYIYLPERGRNVMVDVRAIQAALGTVYHADRIVQELVAGRIP
ncbi:MAG: S46 family peptidase [Gemmatimonadaceae bacterium]